VEAQTNKMLGVASSMDFLPASTFAT